MEGLFQRSINNKQKIIIFYIDSNSQITERFVRVLKLNNDSILVYCYYRKKVRTFKLENILSAGPTRKRVSA